MTLGRSGDGPEPAEHVVRVGVDDWNRYGLSRRGPIAARPVVTPDGRSEAPDDNFTRYRSETAQHPAGPASARRNPRLVANVATVCIVVVLGLALFVVALATAPAALVVSPSPTRPAAATASASGLAVDTPSTSGAAP